MKIRLLQKLLALMVLTGAVPLVAVAFLLIQIGRSQVEGTVEHVHRLEADAAAHRVREVLRNAEDQLVSDFEAALDKMSDEELELWLIYVLGKQDYVFDFRMIAVHDSLGQPIGEPVRLPEESIPKEHRPFYLVEPDDVEAFERHARVGAAIEEGAVQVSDVYVNDRRREALVALAVPIVDPSLGHLRGVVSGEVSLRQVQRIVSDVTIGSVGYAYLVDEDGRAVAHPEFDLVRERRSLTGNGIVEKALRVRRPGAVGFVSTDGTDMLGAHAPVGWEGWQLVVQQPAADAYRPVHEMQVRALYVLLVAFVASAACGVLYVRGIIGPLREVMAGMKRIVDGQFDQRLDVRTGDEVGELANAFNSMGRMLLKYKREIEGWNAELQERVDAKTKALEQAQAQLVQSAKLSALGQMGAGVAHEINNPLAGVVGQAALLKRRIRRLELSEADRTKLESYVDHIQSESSRCREIVHGLLTLSQATSGGLDDFDLNASLERVLVLVQNNARSSGVEVSEELAADLGTIEANEQQVQQVVMHVITNALQAMPGGGSLAVRTRDLGESVAIEVEDSGRGIAAEHLERIFDPFFTTKDVWESTGLGLSVCYTIVQSHGGHIEVDSEVGKGSRFTIVWPRKSTRQAPRSEREKEPVGLARGRPVPA